MFLKLLMFVFMSLSKRGKTVATVPLAVLSVPSSNVHAGALRGGPGPAVSCTLPSLLSYCPSDLMISVVLASSQLILSSICSVCL